MVWCFKPGRQGTGFIFANSRLGSGEVLQAHSIIMVPAERYISLLRSFCILKLFMLPIYRSAGAKTNLMTLSCGTDFKTYRIPFSCKSITMSWVFVFFVFFSIFLRCVLTVFTLRDNLPAICSLSNPAAIN
jgi:hypothetical protein